MSPVFLTWEILEDIHDSSLKLFGGSTGIRDRNALESALAAAENAYFYAQADTYLIAATYAFHLAESQGYVDGNKRAGLGAAMTFLEANGIKTAKDTGELYDAMIAIAEKRMAKNELAELFRRLFPRS
jgi:death on curing protein